MVIRKLKSAASIEHLHAVRINCAHWYERKDFQEWLNSGDLATWHKRNSKPNDYSDVFIIFDHGSGDAETLPMDIYDELRIICHRELPADYGLVWLVNMEVAKEIY